MYINNQDLKKNIRPLLLTVAGFFFLQLLPHLLLAAPGDVLFNDDFERAALGADWTVDTSGGGDAGIGTYTANSGTRSLYSRWSAVSVASRSFDLSSVGGAQLDIWVRRGADAFSEDPEVAGTEDFVVEYFDNGGSWQELTRYVAGNTPGEIFTPTFYLPANALHAGFQIRFRQLGGNGADWDYWHVDDVVLTETAGLPTLVFPFCDDFESGLGNWQVVAGGGNAGTGIQTSGSASNSLYLRWGNVTVTSYDIDLTAVTAGYLNFWLRRGDDAFSEDPDNNEDLIVEYYNNTGIWTSLETFTGNGPAGQIFNRSYPLPADALHGAFKVRFSMTGGSGPDNDYWHVDDVCVEGPPVPPGPLALYHLDESAWGPVTDNSGNAYTGSVVGAVVPDSVSPAVAGDPGTCGYADIPFNNSNNTYDAIDTGIDVDSEIGNVGTIDFWYKSNVRWNGNNGDRQLLDASTTASGQKYFYLTLLNNSRLNFGLEDSSDADFAIEGGNNNFNAGVWVHVAITWDLPNDQLQLYINGNLDVQNTFNTNGVLGNVDTLYLGDNRSTYQIGDMTGNSANGSIDEVRIYNSVLSLVEIQTDMNTTHPCTTGPDHFKVVHNGYGIHCIVEPITVNARDAGDAIFPGYNGTLILDTQNGNGTWMLNTGNGVFNDATLDDGLASYTFDGTDNGEAIFDLYYPTGPAIVDIDVYDGPVRDDDSEGNLVFSPNGFTVTATALSNPPPGLIDTSISAQTAASDFTLYIAAYGQTPSDPTCGIIESYTGGKNLNFWSSYNDPGTGTLQIAVNGSNVATSEGASASQPVAFINGQASIFVNYPDAGLINLAMKDDTTGNPDLPTGIRGTSDNFVVKPAYFELSNIVRDNDGVANPAAIDENGTVFIAAGDPFRVTVSARNSLGNPTPNYGQESSAETVLLTPTIVAAGGVNNPAIGFGTGFGSFVNGVATGTDFYWNEVGIITLTPSIGDGNYLGGGDVSGTASGNVGRFTPAQFTVSANSPEFVTQCGSFTYMGQSFPYNTAPAVIITAMAADGTTTTQNYDNNWWKLGDFSESYTHNGAISAGVSLNSVSAGHTAVSCSDCDGTVTVDFNGSFSYDVSPPEAPPFNGAVDITFDVTDSDGISYASNPYTISAIGFNSGSELRSGRAYAQDVHGTYANIGDTLNMPVATHYYLSDANGWVANTADSCTSFDYTNTDNGITTTISPASSVSIANGVSNLGIQLTGDSGAVGGSSTVNFTWPAWLPGTASATATFGIFRGDDRYIFWREGP